MSRCLITLIITFLSISCAKAWYSDTSFNYRVALTTNATEISADLTDFPIYVDLSDMPAGFWTHAQSDCDDVRVTKSDDTEIPREVVFCDGANGELHFKASGTLSSSADTTFYIYYGNGTATDYATSATYGAENVWDSNYVAVYHLQEDPSGSSPQMIDSTSNSYDGTSAGSMTSGDSVDGKLSGKSLDMDGSNDEINIGTTPDWPINTSFTWQTWAKTTNTSTKTMLAKGTNSFPYTGINMFLTSGLLTLSFVPTTGVSNQMYRRGSTAFNDGSWHLFHGTYDGSSTLAGITLYGDGSSLSTAASGDTWSGSLDATKRLKLGERDGGINWAGGLDEIRLSNSVLTSTWISTEYNNQNSPSTFYSVGAEEAFSAGAFKPQVIFF